MPISPRRIIIMLKYSENGRENMDYISAQQAAEKWGVSLRRAQQLCEAGLIEGAMRFVGVWMIPKDAINPKSRHFKNRPKKRQVGADEQ